MPCDSRSPDLIRFAQQVIGRLSDPISWEHVKIDVGATIGIALYPQDGADAEALIRSADIAMYRGKREGRNTFRFFEQAMDEELKARVTLECELRSAIQKGEINATQFHPEKSGTAGLDIIQSFLESSQEPPPPHANGVFL